VIQALAETKGIEKLFCCKLTVVSSCMQHFFVGPEFSNACKQEILHIDESFEFDLFIIRNREPLCQSDRLNDRCLGKRLYHTGSQKGLLGRFDLLKQLVIFRPVI